MQYCEPVYLLIFLPIVVLIYQLVPKKVRPYILLISSFVFMFSLSGKLFTYLVLTVFSIHHFGLWIKSNLINEKDALENAKKDEKKDIKIQYLKSRKKILLLGILIQAGFLVILKYLPFICLNINNLLNLLNIDFVIIEPKIIAPIGISFYTLMAISYLVDIYRQKIEAEENLAKLGLYMSFFPGLMEGPIARFEQTANDLYRGEKIHYKSLCFGLQRILYGLIKKIVVADRLNAIVKTIFLKYDTFDGGILLLGVILYTVQLYMDFSGVMDVAIGTGEIFNTKLPENFKQPFFANSISNFWSRWHITLGTWFKDYIFYPISLSKFSKKITKTLKPKLGNHFGPLVAGSIALFAVWLCNGIWHGAGYQYIFFGMYHFVFILLGNIFSPLFNKFYDLVPLKKEGIIMRTIGAVRTTTIVLFGELFFRAATLEIGFKIFREIFTNFSIKSFENQTFLKLGIDGKDFIIVGITVLIVFIISIFKEKGVDIREWISRRPIYIRWAIYYIALFYLLIFGAYGIGYLPVEPMYASY